jgi:hypothetical protein
MHIHDYLPPPDSTGKPAQDHPTFRAKSHHFSQKNKQNWYQNPGRNSVPSFGTAFVYLKRMAPKVGTGLRPGFRDPKAAPRFCQKVGQESPNFVLGGAPFSGRCLPPLLIHCHGVFGTRAAVDAAMSRTPPLGGGRLSSRARAGVPGGEGRRENFWERSWAAWGGFRLDARAGGGGLSPRARAGASSGEGE